MKQALCLSLLLLLCCASPPAEKSTPPSTTQTKKEPTAPAPTWKKSAGAPPVDLLGVSFLTDQEASVVADMGPGNGPILHTQNAGASWLIGTTASEILTDVSFDGALGAAVGYAGQISLSDDGARSWKIARRDEETILRGVARRQALVVAVGDSALLVSRDAGKTFDSTPLGEPTDLQDLVLWSDTDSAAVTSGGELLRTNDLWRTFSRSPLTSEPLFGVARRGAALCAVGGKGAILCLGAQDKVEATQSGVSVDLFDVAFDGTRGVAVGAKGTILTTKDGLGWTQEASNTTEDLYAVALRGGHAIVVGTNGTILTRTLE